MSDASGATPVKVAINGFGRIGRLVFRALYELGLLGKKIEVVAIGDIVPANNLAYLLKFDSIQGGFTGKVSHDTEGESETANVLIVDGKRIKIVSAEKPKDLPWGDLGVDVVIESTGLFADAKKAGGHITAGAKKVIISAPASGDLLTVVMGVNHDKYDPDQHHVVSNASCTTNCLAPVVHALLTEGIGIKKGLMTTVHAYTATQKTVDGPNRKSFRDGRTAAQNIIPASTGAAKAVGLVCPDVAGKLTGKAFRVPTPTVSVIDLTFVPENATSYDDVIAALRRASNTYLSDILQVTTDPVVSSDFIHCAASSIVDVNAGMALDDEFLQIVSWYDNEWGYSNRVCDLLHHIIAQRL